jgi:hypothetical protein
LQRQPKGRVGSPADEGSPGSPRSWHRQLIRAGSAAPGVARVPRLPTRCAARGRGSIVLRAIHSPVRLVQEVLLLRHNIQAPRPPAIKPSRAQVNASPGLSSRYSWTAMLSMPRATTTRTHRAHLGSSFPRGVGLGGGGGSSGCTNASSDAEHRDLKDCPRYLATRQARRTAPAPGAPSGG